MITPLASTQVGFPSGPRIDGIANLYFTVTGIRRWTCFPLSSASSTKLQRPCLNSLPLDLFSLTVGFRIRADREPAGPN